MKFIHSGYVICIEFEENWMEVLVIESPQILTEIVIELKNQCMGQEGRFVLSKDNEILSMKKEIEFVLEPFSLDCNNKKILSKIYQTLEKNEVNYPNEYRAKFNESLMQYLDYICNQSEISLDYSENIDFQDILKMADVKVRTESETLLEQVLEQILLQNQLLGQNLFVFLNLKSFLSAEEIKELYKECFYKKIFLLLIESNVGEKMDEERVCLIDKDLCIIYF